MLKLLNTELLIAILAALTLLASAVLYQRHEAEHRKQEEITIRKTVEENKRKQNSAAGSEGKTWKSYIP